MKLSAILGPLLDAKADHELLRAMVLAHEAAQADALEKRRESDRLRQAAKAEMDRTSRDSRERYDAVSSRAPEESKKDNNKEDKKESAAKPRGVDDFVAELIPILDAERIDALVAVRRKKGATFSALAGRSLSKALRSWPNIAEAADEMVLRNWTGFKPDWMAKRGQGPPGKRNYVDVAMDQFAGKANGTEGIFGSHGDAQRIPPRLIESRPDDANLRGGYGGRIRPSDC